MKTLVFFTFCLIALSSLVQENSINFSPLCTDYSENPVVSGWKALGPFEDSKKLPQNIGLVSCFAVHPTNSNIVFLGSNTGGIYCCENFHSEAPVWKNVTNSLQIPGLGISQIVFNEQNPSVVYASSGYSAGYGEGFSVGVLKSIDGGKSWTTIGPGLPNQKRVPSRIIVDYQNPKRIYYAEVDKLYLSENEGKEWKIIFTLPDSKGLNRYHTNRLTRSIIDLEQNRFNPSVLLISTDYSGNNESVEHCLVYKTTDGGKNWKKITFSTPIKTDKLVFTFSKVTSSQIWATYTFSEKGKNINKLLRSPDLGETWQDVSTVTISGAGYHRQDIECSPVDSNTLYLGGYFVSKSTDGGKTFRSISQGLHVDTRYLRILEGENHRDLIIVANDGGISCSYDDFRSWTNKNGWGLNIKQFIAIGVGNRSNNIIAGGTQDNDICIYDSIWHTPQLTNDGADAIVHNQDNSLIFAEPWCCDASQLKIRSYHKESDSWKIIGSTPPPEKEGNNLRPLEQLEGGELLIGHHDVWKSETPKLNWKKISDFSSHFPVPADAKIKHLAVSKKEPNDIAVIFTGPSWSSDVKNSYLLCTHTGGGTGKNDWKDLTLNLPTVVPRWLEMNCVAFDQNTEGTLLIGLNFLYTASDSLKKYPYNGAWRIIRSTDSGLSWEDYSKNLPPFPVQDIISEEGTRGGYYAATNVGVFYTNDELYPVYGWVCFNSNLPVTIVTDLEINYCTGKLVAATFGHGLWISDLAYHAKKPVEVKGEQLWTSHKDINTDLVLKKNCRLTISNKASIAMAKGSTLYIEDGAILLLDDARIGNLCGNEWKGVQFRSKKRTLFKKRTIGKIELKNGGEILY